MGACSSKNEEPHRDGDTAPSRGLRRGRSKGNFNTDLRDKNETTKTFSEVLVRKNQLPVWEVYDLSQGVELGRGACGMVQVVKKISSGEARRLRLFRRSLRPHVPRDRQRGLLRRGEGAEVDVLAILFDLCFVIAAVRNHILVAA